jgi:hypothetical protein
MSQLSPEKRPSHTSVGIGSAAACFLVAGAGAVFLLSADPVPVSPSPVTLNLADGCFYARASRLSVRVRDYECLSKQELSEFKEGHPFAETVAKVKRPSMDYDAKFLEYTRLYARRDYRRAHPMETAKERLADAADTLQQGLDWVKAAWSQ